MDPVLNERRLAVGRSEASSLANGRPCRGGRPFAELSYATRTIAVVLGQVAALEARRHCGSYDMGYAPLRVVNPRIGPTVDRHRSLRDVITVVAQCYRHRSDGWGVFAAAL